MHGTHPSTTPGAIIGYRKNGTPIRLIAGGRQQPGDGDAGQGTEGQDGGTGAGDGQQGDQGDDGGTAGTGGQGDDGGAGQSGDGTGAQQGDDAAARTIRAVRADFKAERTRRQKLETDLAAIQQSMTDQQTATAERNKALAKALGLPGSEDPPDPAELARELEAARKATKDAIDASTARERELTVENALLKGARRHGADPELLADSRSFMRTLASLDPAGEDFATDLADAIKAAVDANPAFKIATPASGGSSGTSNASGNGGGDGKDGKDSKPSGQKAGSRTTAPPARSGGDDGHNGAPGGQRQWTREDLARAGGDRKAIKAAMEAGLLVDLGYGVPKAGRTRR